MNESEKEGVLRLQPSGRWAVCRPGCQPVEITSGHAFRMAVPGTDQLVITTMEYRHFRNGGGEYYSTNGLWLEDGLRVVFAVRRVPWLPCLTNIVCIRIIGSSRKEGSAPMHTQTFFGRKPTAGMGTAITMK